MFLRMVFESTENTIFVLSENCSCSLNLMFSMAFVFFIKKKKKKKKNWESNVFSLFSLFSLFLRTKNNFQKQ